MEVGTQVLHVVVSTRQGLLFHMPEAPFRPAPATVEAEEPSPEDGAPHGNIGVVVALAELRRQWETAVTWHAGTHTSLCLLHGARGHASQAQQTGWWRG